MFSKCCFVHHVLLFYLCLWQLHLVNFYTYFLASFFCQGYTFNNMLYLTTIMEKPHLLWRGLFEGSRITDLYLLIVYLLPSYNLLYSQNLLYLILSYLTTIYRWNLSVCLSFGLVNFSWRCGQASIIFKFYFTYLIYLIPFHIFIFIFFLLIMI